MGNGVTREKNVQKKNLSRYWAVLDFYPSSRWRVELYWISFRSNCDNNLMQLPSINFCFSRWKFCDKQLQSGF